MDHQHLEEHCCPDSCQLFIEGRLSVLAVGDSCSVNKILDKDGLAGHDWGWEVDIWVVFVLGFEFHEVLCFDIEIYLVDEGLFEGIVGYWDLEETGYLRHHIAKEEDDINVSLNIFFNFRVPDFNCYSCSLINSLIHLPNRSYTNRYSIKTIKYFINRLPKFFQERSLRCRERMRWRFFP